jgi:hypothetical protein
VQEPTYFICVNGSFHLNWTWQLEISFCGKSAPHFFLGGEGKKIKRKLSSKIARAVFPKGNFELFSGEGRNGRE